ncbi:MAG: PIN domain-containing protein [Spirochaetales bacterium]|nr:PIN domain-containing protein [Spirochaetales bacterium]
MKKQVTLPDTNVVLRYLLNDHPEMSKEAYVFFEKVRTGEKKALILESVLTECVYVLTKFYKIPGDEAAQKLSKLLHYKGIINPDADNLINALHIFSKSSIALVDCIIISKLDKPDYHIFTFDKDLIKVRNKINSGM